MAGRSPGTICLTESAWIDDGTLCLALSPAPIVVGLAETAYAVGRQAVAIELRRLGRDVGAALEYIESLPEHARRSAAYEFFAAFFDHYLPKKFLRHYVWGGGRSLALSEREMVDCNPYINVMNCRSFRDTLDARAASRSSSVTEVSLRCPASALTNGTLGQFSVPMRATLTYRGADDWELEGRMSFFDRWDFDPKDFTTGGRSLQGELKTRFAHYTLPGDSFEITSAEAPFSQRAADATVTWKGGQPVLVPDKIAQLDVDLKNRE
jgi:hypothetical protein